MRQLVDLVQLGLTHVDGLGEADLWMEVDARDHELPAAALSEAAARVVVVAVDAVTQAPARATKSHGRKTAIAGRHELGFNARMKHRFRVPGWAKPLLALPPIAAGIVVVVLLVQGKDAPERVERVERSQPARVIRVKTTSVLPRSIAYGTVEPARVWRAVSEVSGKIVEKHPKLEVGEIVEKGTVLLRVDPREFELAVSELQASLVNYDAQLSQLDTREENTKASLAIESRVLEISNKELERKRELFAGGQGSQADVDQEERATLQQRKQVRDLENTLNLVPAERAALVASKNATQAKLETAKLTLAGATIVAPFHCRVHAVSVEQSQFVGIGQELAEGHGMAAAEVPAQVPMGKLRPLMPDGGQPLLTGEVLFIADMEERFGLSAIVRLQMPGLKTEWPARVARFSSTIDAKTRTMSAIVVVDKPYEKVIPGKRPPLIAGMFCEVELRGRAKPGRVLIPRAALHEGEAYVVESNRLVRKAVTVDFALGDFVCLAKGLDDGETLVVSDLVPAIDGMLLSSRVDEELQSRLAAVARGEASLR